MCLTGAAPAKHCWASVKCMRRIVYSPQDPELKGTLFHMLTEGLVQCQANAVPLNACPSSFAGLGEAPGQRWEGLLAS